MNICDCGHERYGYTLKDGVLSKSVEKSVHMLRLPQNSWCVQQDVIDYHFERGEIVQIDIINAEPPYESYSIDIKQFMHVKYPLDRGHGPQYRVPLKYWNRTKRGKEDAGAPKQLTLL